MKGFGVKERTKHEKFQTHFFLSLHKTVKSLGEILVLRFLTEKQFYNIGHR